jgi:NTP pyrophosphatase (non-canonical NTP hydrolase)
MAEFANVGMAEAILMEEMAEAIQVIAKKVRFGGEWDEVPPSKDKTRWEQLEAEMQDVMLAWENLQMSAILFQKGAK